jgi:Holliday junction resolvase RusA-like endonuclease
MNDNLIWIPFNVPSSKNSRINTSRGSFMSKTSKAYITKLGIQSYSSSKQEVKGYVNRPNLIEQLRTQFEKNIKGKVLPLEIGFHFVRDSRRKIDFHNIVQIILDLLTAHNIIDDDNMDCVLPYALKIESNAYSIDKENPGVWIKIN